MTSDHAKPAKKMRPKRKKTANAKSTPDSTSTKPAPANPTPTVNPAPTNADLLSRLDALSAVFDLTEWYAGPHDLQQLLDATAQRITRVMNAKACGVRLLNEETGELKIQAVCNLSDEYLSKGKILVHENPVDAAALSGQTVFIKNVATDPRVRFPEHAVKEGIVSGLCVPMTYRGKTVGVIRVYTDKPHDFIAAEEALLRHAGSQAAAGIIQARLIEEQRRAERQQQQVRYAAEIQRRMIPNEAPIYPGLDVGGVYAPSLDLGGDFYDFIELPGKRLGLVVADVVGKGLPAAIMMASARAALRAHSGASSAPPPPSPAEVVARVNEHMHRDSLVSEFATLFYAVFERAKRLIYTNAGHDPPLLLRGETFIELGVGGLVVGVSDTVKYEQDAVDLQSGDILVLYTDGVIDTMNFDGELFGRSRLRKSIWKYRAASAHELAKQLLWQTRRFAGLVHQTDDTTLLAIKIL
jgi:serine phosphatase RsbU (regulator of sigma subunit)